MANVGTLVVELAASTAKFQQDLGKATAIAQANAKRLESAFAGVKNAFAALGVTVGVGAFVGTIKGALEAADHLDRLSQTTGLTVEALAGLEFAAKQSGTDIDGVAKAVGRLNVRIAEARGGNQEAADTFKALGLSLSDVNKLSEQDILLHIADSFAKWQDGANKAGIASRAFGKQFGDIIPLLNEGGSKLREQIEFVQKWGGVSTETAARAREFNETLNKLHLLVGAFSRNLSSALLPTLQTLADAFVETKEKGDGFAGLAGSLATDFTGLAVVAANVAFVFHGVGTEIGGMAAQLTALAHGDFKGFTLIGDEMKRDAAKARADIDALTDKLLNPGKNGPGQRGPRTPAPTIEDQSINDTQRKILENALKALERLIGDEKDQLNARLAFLQLYYQQDLLGTREYYATRRQVADDALAATTKDIDEEIGLLRKRLSANIKPQEREDIEGKIAESTDRRRKVERDAAIEGARGFLEESKAAQDFRDKIEDLAIKLAELSGDTVTAAGASFDFQNRELRKRIELERQSGDAEIRRQAEIGSAALDQLRARTVLQAQLNDAERSYAQTVTALDILQQKVALDQAAGAVTELGALEKRSELNRAFIPIIRAQIAAQEELASHLSGKDATDALLKLDQLKLKLEEVANSTDLVAKKFNNAFAEPLQSAIEKLATGAGSLRDVFNQLVKDIEGNLVKIAAQNVTESLFGKGGALSGIGGFFASAFGFGGKAGGDAAGAAALTGAGTVLTSAGVELTAAAVALSGAAVGLGASGAANIAGGFASSAAASDIFSFLGFAGGGSPPVGRASIVGERGPELFVPRTGGTIIPNHVFQSKRAQHGVTIGSINVNVSGDVSRDTADQIAVRIGNRVDRATRRNR